jgi:peptide-methionine (S)-S-oxide reductase
LARSPGRSQAPLRQKRPPFFPGERFLFQPCLVVFVSSVTLGERKAIVEAVCNGDTDHAEVVRVSFDTGRISLREVLEIFFTIHDPTTPNRQGNDVGTQYRSGIYFHNAEQQRVAREVLDEVNAHHKGRGVTELLPEANYSRAEDYHQHYFANHPNQGYCAFVVAPKVEKFKKTFASRVKAA